MHAKEPDQLLFHALPLACGMEPFSAGETDREAGKTSSLPCCASPLLSCSELMTIC